MKLEIIAIGRMKAGPERDIARRYAERFAGPGKGIGLDGPRLIELGESLARRSQDRKAEEGEAILAARQPGSKLVLFDEGGVVMDSLAFSGRIGEWRDAGAAAISLVIGGADGLSPRLHAEAALVLAFGRMTLPHQLVRILVLEQLYRAATILVGHPYHRA